MFHTQRRQTNSTDVRGGSRSARAYITSASGEYYTDIQYHVCPNQIASQANNPRAAKGARWLLRQHIHFILLIQPTNKYIHMSRQQGYARLFIHPKSFASGSLLECTLAQVSYYRRTINRKGTLPLEPNRTRHSAPFHPKTGAELLTWPQTCPALQHNKRHLVTQLAGFMTLKLLSAKLIAPMGEVKSMHYDKSVDHVLYTIYNPPIALAL